MDFIGHDLRENNVKSLSILKDLEMTIIKMKEVKIL